MSKRNAPKAKTSDQPFTLSFERIGHFWFDNGILGLYRIIHGVSAVHAELPPVEDLPDLLPPPTHTCGLDEHLGEAFDVQVSLSRDALTLLGTQENCQKLLEVAYERLLYLYYNTSTRKQREEHRGYNTVYLPKENKFFRTPKKNPTGIAKLIFDKAARPDKLSWVTDPNTNQKLAPENIPPEKNISISSNELWQRLNLFLERHKLPLPKEGLYLEPLSIHPKCEIRVAPTKKMEHCFFFGSSPSKTEEIKQTTYPLMTSKTGNLSFYSNAQKPEKVDWRLAYLSKFIPVTSFFTTQFINKSEHLHAFIAHCPSLKKLNDLYDRIRIMAVWHENHYHNFKNTLGHYFIHANEIAFDFFYTMYQLFKRTQNAIAPSQEDELFDEELFDEEESSLSHSSLQEDELREAIAFLQEEAPFSFHLLYAQDSNVKANWPFSDVSYLFRLFYALENEAKLSLPKLARSLLLFDESTELRSVLRNKIFGHVLQKRSTLREVEQFCYQASQEEKRRSFRIVEQFVQFYEILLRSGESMFKEMVETAASLGKQIGRALATKVLSKDESLGRAKGALFRLRKCRTLGEFINEIPRLQHRYGLSVSNQIYEGNFLTESSFEEFKGFCMVAAFNALHAGLKDLPKEQEAA